MKTTGVFCNMDNPVGKAVGNALEVEEAVNCLKGKGPEDLEELVVIEGSTYLLFQIFCKFHFQTNVLFLRRTTFGLVRKHGRRHRVPPIGHVI